MAPTLPKKSAPHSQAQPALDDEAGEVAASHPAHPAQAAAALKRPDIHATKKPKKAAKKAAKVSKKKPARGSKKSAPVPEPAGGESNYV